MLTLDHRIFGNGHGMASPGISARYYWLVDTSRQGHPGDLYTFMQGLGAQLHSFQWTHPKAGETRRLIGRDFRPFHSTRRSLRVEVAWCTRLPEGIDAANAAPRQIQADLNSGWIDDPIPWTGCR